MAKSLLQAVQELSSEVEKAFWGAEFVPRKNMLIIDLSDDVDERFPNKCPRCKGPAYVGLNAVDCKARC